MITAEQLKAGVDFKFKGSTYSAEIQDVENTKKPQYFIANYSRYCGNIKSIGKTSFTMYTFVMGKYISVRVPFADCRVEKISSTFFEVDEEQFTAQ